MTSEERDQLVNVIEQALVEASGTTTENVYSFFERAEPWVQNIAQLLGRVQSRESLIALIDQLPARLEAFIPLALTFIPLLPAMAVKDAKEAFRPAAEALAAGPPGRPNAIPEDMKPGIVDYISDLEKRGVLRRVAQQRTAQHFGLKLRSVQRVWRDRKRYANGQSGSVWDVIAAVNAIE